MSQILANHDLMMKEKVHVDNEVVSLRRKNAELSEVLDWTIAQQNLARSEVDNLHRHLEAIQIEKQTIEEKCQGLCAF